MQNVGRQKITFAEMRAAGVHWTAISGDRWPDDVRLSDL